MSAAALLEVQHATVEYPTGRRLPPLRAIDDVSLRIGTAETLGLVGESGSGKSTLGRAILGLVPLAGGSIHFDGRDMTHASRATRRELSSSLQVVFQDPYGSLNPARTIGQTLAETLRAAGGARSRAQVVDRMAAMLEEVGLPGDAARRYPAHFSGGQRQRIAIARALMASPRLVVCDEPVSALDISVQAQVLNVLTWLQREHGLGYLFISHDIAVVRHVANRIAVLYRGRIMEHGNAPAVLERPAHPYTATLLAAAPVPDPRRQRRRHSMGHIGPSAGVPGSEEHTTRPALGGCPFAPRCSHAIEICGSHMPALDRTDDGVLVACHRWRELRADPPVPDTPVRALAVNTHDTEDQ